jgi:NDP-sugar pyrophosphorylase family protein
MKGSHVGEGAVINDAIIDKDVKIGNGVVIGTGGPAETPPHKDLGDGLVVIGKGTSIPAGTVIGRHVLIDPYCTEEHFTERTILAGTHFHWS